MYLAALRYYNVLNHQWDKWGINTIFVTHFFFSNTYNFFNTTGYAADPISEWKKRASKMQGLNAVEDEPEEESEDEPEQPHNDKGKPVDSGTKHFSTSC